MLSVNWDNSAKRKQNADACDCVREQNFRTFNAGIEVENLRLKQENAELKERLQRIELSHDLLTLDRD